MQFTYRVMIDTNGNGRYDTNVAAYLKSGSINRGRSGRVGVAPTGTANLVMNSKGGEFYLDRGTAIAGLAKGRRIKVQVNADGRLVNLFDGRIADILPIPHPQTGFAWEAELLCSDRTEDVAARDIDLDLRRGARIDRLIAAVLREARYGGEKNLSRLTPHIEFAWFEDTNALQAIDELVEADGGTFFMDRNGAATFHPRKFRPVRRKNVELTVDNLVVEHQDTSHDVITDVAVQANRIVVAKLQEVWSEGGPFKLKPGESDVFYVDFGEPVLGLKTPDKDKKDYAANDPDNKNTDRTSLLAVTLTRVSATRARVKVKNTSGSLTIRVTKLRLRGRMLRWRQPLMLRSRANDLQVIGAHSVGNTKVGGGKKIQDGPEGQYLYRRFVVDNPWVQLKERARDLARYYRSQLGKVQPNVRLTLRPIDDEDVKDLAQLDISDRISYTNTAIGLSSRDYWIEHIKHEFSGGRRWRTTVEGTPAFVIDANRRVGGMKVGTSAKVS